MRRITMWAAAATVLFAAGCGGDDNDNSTATTATAAATPAATATPAQTATPAAGERPDSDDNGIPDVQTKKGKLGEALTLLGQGTLDANGKPEPQGEVKVTVKKVIGPFSGFDLDAGRKLIGVQIRFTNVADKLFDDPQPNATLTLIGGETGKQTNLISVNKESPCDNPSIKLKKGQSKDTCLAFEVPKDGKLQTLEFGMDSGFGDTGLWSLQ